MLSGPKRQRVYFPQKYFALSALSFAAVAGLQPSAQAADVTPMPTIDAQSTAGIAPAKTLRSGGIVSGVSAFAAQDSFDMSRLGLDASAEGSSTQSKGAAVYAGFGVTKNIDLSLSLRGVEDSVVVGAPSVSAASSTESTKSAFAFAGVTLMTKFKIIDQSGFTLSLAPFFESASAPNAEAAQQSLVRSDKSKTGWLAMASYGAEKIAEFSVNFGYRYRQEEQVGSLKLGDEMLVGAGAKAFLSDSVAVLGSVNGRSFASEKLSLDARAGLGFYQKQWEVTAYGGSNLQGKLGEGRSFAGLSVSYVIDKGRKGNNDQRVIGEEESSSSQFAQSSQSSNEKRAELSSGSSSYPEMNATDIDPLADLPKTADDDFSVIEARMREYNNGKPSSIELVERELKEIHDAEKKAADERQNRDSKQKERDRQDALKRASDRAHAEKSMKKDAEEEAAKLKGITKDELNWRGLE